MDKEPPLLIQEFTSSMLLTQMALGSLASVLILAMVPLMFGGLNFIIPNPISGVIAGNILHWIVVLTPWLYVAVLLGGLAAIAYAVVVKDTDSKGFLLVWGVVQITGLFIWVWPSLLKTLT
jgi:hypothetical protein